MDSSYTADMKDESSSYDVPAIRQMLRIRRIESFAL